MAGGGAGIVFAGGGASDSVGFSGARTCASGGDGSAAVIDDEESCASAASRAAAPLPFFDPFAGVIGNVVPNGDAIRTVGSGASSSVLSCFRSTASGGRSVFVIECNGGFDGVLRGGPVGVTPGGGAVVEPARGGRVGGRKI